MRGYKMVVIKNNVSESISIILSSLFLWEAPPHPDRQEQEFKKIEMSVSYHNTSKYLSDKELQKILDAEEEYEKNLTDADRARQREIDEISRYLYGDNNVISPPAPRNPGFPEENLLPLVIAEEPPVAPEYGKGFFDVINTTDAFSTITSEKMAGCD